jgi:hypothetical protein
MGRVMKYYLGLTLLVAIALWLPLPAMQLEKIQNEIHKPYVKGGIQGVQRGIAQDIWGQRLQRVQSQDIINEHLISLEFQATIGRMQENFGLTDAVLIAKAQRLSDIEVQKIIGPRYKQIELDYIWAFACGDADSAKKKERGSKFFDNFPIALIPLRASVVMSKICNPVSVFETLKLNSGQPTVLGRGGYILLLSLIQRIEPGNALRAKLLDKAQVEWMNEILKQNSSRGAFVLFLASNELAREWFEWSKHKRFMTDKTLEQDITNIMKSLDASTDILFSQAVQQFQAHQKKQ